MDFFFFIALLFVMMYFLMIRPQVREQRMKQELMGSLKKGDKVITIGGVFGTVGAVHEHDIVIKVDEKSNTRIRVLKTAVHQRTSDDDEPASAPAQAEDSPKGKKGKAKAQEGRS